jgi:hypothetical protein
MSPEKDDTVSTLIASDSETGRAKNVELAEKGSTFVIETQDPYLVST